MYKLAILFFFLTAFNSQSLIDSYHLKFSNENATYTLQIKEGNLIMENQPNVTVTAIADNNPITDTDKQTNKIYKITKGATFEGGLKIGGTDDIEIEKIGGEDQVEIEKIGETDDIEIEKIGEEDQIEIEKIGEADDVDVEGKIGIKEHQAYEIVLSYASVMVVEKSSNEKTTFPIENGVYLIIADGKFAFFR